MRGKVVLGIVGSFLQVFGVTLAIPLLFSVYYSEPWSIGAGFLSAAVLCLASGFGMKFIGRTDSPSTGEAMSATVIGWMLAVGFGAIPLLQYLGAVDALFEASAGLTTTGISVFIHPEKLPHSILFWRSFMQWIGGLGILTFFIAVIRESGGASRRLFSAEAHKTDAGSIRPSLMKSIISLWKVYGFLTVVIIASFILLGVSEFDALLHAFSTISTGGFSTMGASIAGFDSTAVETVSVLFMLIGGVNFVLLYRVLRSEFSSLLKNSEFRLYITVFLLVAAAIGAELYLGGAELDTAALDASFQAAAVISSTGFSTMSLTSLSIALQLVLIGVMFVGGSLGSTSGGLKMFRLKTLVEMVKVRLRAYTLPETAVNRVKIDGELLEDSTVRTISVLFFVWIAVVFASTVLVVAADGATVMGALSGSVSSAGNMGPVYMPMEQLVELSAVTKLTWIVVMLAGRLEMLPVLAIFNSEIFKH